jgi:hypothetical protein
VAGGVQLGPLGTATTNRPIVPALGDYDGEIGGMIRRENRSTRRKPAPVPLCPPQTPHAVRMRTRAAAVKRNSFRHQKLLINFPKACIFLSSIFFPTFHLLYYSYLIQGSNFLLFNLLLGLTVIFPVSF